MKKYIHLVVTVLAVCITAAAQAQSDKPPPGDPCKLLTDAELSSVFQDIKPAKRDTSTDKYGIASCEWKHGGGRFVAQLMKGEDTIESELRTRAMGIIDPLKSSRSNPVRYVTVKGVGDAALAFVEPRDEKRGVLNGLAVLIAQRGDKQVVLFSGDLPLRERNAALKVLEDLGRAAVKRL